MRSRSLWESKNDRASPLIVNSTNDSFRSVGISQIRQSVGKSFRWRGQFWSRSPAKILSLKRWITLEMIFPSSSFEWWVCELFVFVSPHLFCNTDYACIMPWNIMVFIALNAASGSEATRAGSSVAGRVEESLSTTGLCTEWSGISKGCPLGMASVFLVWGALEYSLFKVCSLDMWFWFMS